MALSLTLSLALCAASQLVPDERPPEKGEWGFRPREGEACQTNPPAFVVRHHSGADRYEFIVSRDRDFKDILYRGENNLPCHCPPRTLPAGRWYWRFRFRRKGQWSVWGTVRQFTLGSEAVTFPMPRWLQIMNDVPSEHPRLFFGDQMLAEIRKMAEGNGKEAWDRLVRRAEGLLEKPPLADEPPLYPPGTKPFSAEWQALRYENRDRTIRVLEGAAILGFVWRVSGEEKFAEAGRALLGAAARWNPQGSTSYRYNDEAAIPYMSNLTRAYTLLHRGTPDEVSERCRRVMEARGREIYMHLCPQHLWRPYRSLAGRAWYVLGEAGIAFFRDIPEAADWLHFALNVLYHCYPVWADEDGGWHEGLAAFQSEFRQFSEWAVTLRNVLNIDPYRHPFFAQAGYFPLYVQVPGSEGGGFGAGSTALDSRGSVELCALLAREKGNPCWQWYVDAHGLTEPEGGYFGLLRGEAAAVLGKEPSDLPSSRLFRGVGIAALNSTLLEADKNVAALFKSSPFGTVGLGDEAQNSFLFHAFGKRFLVASRDAGVPSLEFRRAWLQETRSSNSLTVEGIGQLHQDWNARGRIEDFADTPKVAYVCGEAGEAYAGGLVKRFARHLLLVKESAVVVWDEVELAEPRRIAFHLHAPAAFQKIKQWGPETYQVDRDPHACLIKFFWKDPFSVTVTDKLDVEPPPGGGYHHWHLTAETAERRIRHELVTLIGGVNRAVPDPYGGVPLLTEVEGGSILSFPTAEGTWSVVLRSGERVKAPSGEITDKIAVQVALRQTGETSIELVRPGVTAGEKTGR